MSLITKITALGYQVLPKNEKTNNDYSDSFYYLISPQGIKKPIPKRNSPLYIGVGNVTSVDEADNAVKNGIGIKTSGEAIYKEVYSLDDFCKYFYRCSVRTYNYLNTCKQNIGFLGSNCRELGYENLNPADKIAVVGNYDIYKKQDEYICCSVKQYDIDGFAVDMLRFSCIPGTSAIQTANVIDKIEGEFLLGHLAENFCCWECGHLTHWLDIKGSLVEKYEHLQDKYCGC